MFNSLFPTQQVKPKEQIQPPELISTYRQLCIKALYVGFTYDELDFTSQDQVISELGFGFHVSEGELGFDVFMNFADLDNGRNNIRFTIMSKSVFNEANDTFCGAVYTQDNSPDTPAYFYLYDEKDLESIDQLLDEADDLLCEQNFTRS